MNGQIATLVTGAVSVGIATAIVYCNRKWPPRLPQVGGLGEEDVHHGRAVMYSEPFHSPAGSLDAEKKL